MIHPDTELKYVSPDVGYGVFATRLIPVGTMTYVIDELEIVIQPDDKLINDPRYSESIYNYGYQIPDGSYVVSWDLAKYINHCCHYNNLTTGYGFDIAVHDIQPGEEIRDDYSAYTFDIAMDLKCQYSDCRKRILPGDFDKYVYQWDKDLLLAFTSFLKVNQPLLKYLDSTTHEELMDFLTTGQNYRSIKAAKLSIQK